MSAVRAAPGSMRDGDWLVGWGCATAMYPANVAPATARVTLRADGRARVQVAAHDVGTGTYTVVTQVAAERLGLSPDAVQVEMGDSALPAAPVSGGSNVTASVTAVLMKACDAIGRALFQEAVRSGPLGGHPLDALRLAGGHVVAPDGRSEPLAEVFGRLGTEVIEQYAEWFPPGQSSREVKALYEGSAAITGGTEGDRVRFALGAELVEVRVHARTREIRVPRIVGAFAAGRIVNPRTARSQLMGGMIWGIGSALHEATELDHRHARYVNTDLAEYLIPVNADVPSVEVILVPEVDEHLGPGGIKGVGELGNVGTAAAIAAAVHHATGRRVRDLPIRLDDLL